MQGTGGLIRSTALVSLLTMSILLIGGCSRQSDNKGPKYGASPVSDVPVYHFAVHPLHNPSRLMQVYQPLIDYLNGKLVGGKLVLEASRDYASFERKYQEKNTDIILPNPWQTIQAMSQGYHVVAMAGDPKDFKGLIIVRKDQGIARPSDLIGKPVSYPAATALAACIMPQYFLYSQGVNVTRDVENRYVGSQESSIMNVYLKKTVAGATWPPPWRAFQAAHPREADELKVMWETEPLVNNSVMIRDDLPAEIGNQVQKYLIELDGSESGKKILAGMETTCFYQATNKDYDVVKLYMARFEEKIRKVETK